MDSCSVSDPNHGDVDPALRPSNSELPPDRRFAHGMVDWALGNRLTARELAMLDLMNTITDKDDWETLIFDDAAVRGWRLEASRNLLISQKTWAWCLDELRIKAKDAQRTKTVLVLDAGSRVAKSQPDLPAQALAVLKATAADLRSEMAPDDLFPSVVNLVHPSYSPLVYGRTRILPEEQKVSRQDMWAHFGRGALSILEPHQLVEMMAEDARAEPLVLNGWHCADVLDFVPQTYHHGRSKPVSSERLLEKWSTEKPWRYSNRFQWLPCDVEFQSSRDYDVRISGYISTLHPSRFPDAYSAIEQVISKAIPQWNSVVMRINPDTENARPFWNVSFGRTPPRIRLFGLLKNPEPPVPYWSELEGDFYSEINKLDYKWDTLDDGERRQKLGDIIARMEQAPKGERRIGLDFFRLPITLRLRNLIHPEPGSLFTVQEWAAGKNVGRVLIPKSSLVTVARSRGRPHARIVREDSPGEDGFHVDGPLDFVDKPVQLHLDYRKRGLQVYVKMQSIELNAENPVVTDGDWALEGMFNEHIVATSMYFFDIENVSDVRLSFQQPANFVDQKRMNRCGVHDTDSLFAWRGTFNPAGLLDHMQRLGSITANTGRLVSFPNTLQYRFEPIELEAGSQAGHVRFLTVCLADPNYRVVSTSRVPPQRFDWWLRDAFPSRYFSKKGLPVEIQWKIATYAEEKAGLLMTEEVESEFRAWTAWERTRLLAEVNGEHWNHDWINHAYYDDI